MIFLHGGRAELTKRKDESEASIDHFQPSLSIEDPWTTRTLLQVFSQHLHLWRRDLPRDIPDAGVKDQNIQVQHIQEVCLLEYSPGTASTQQYDEVEVDEVVMDAVLPHLTIMGLVVEFP